MRRLFPLVVLAVVLVGCSEAPIDPSLYTATVEVKGMV
jgi:hypothetical protein